MTLEAQVGARLGADFAMGVVASRAIDLSRSANLVRMGDLLLPHHIGVAAVADLRRDRAHLARVGMC